MTCGLKHEMSHVAERFQQVANEHDVDLAAAAVRLVISRAQL
jgi:hypothetical protein